MTGATPSGGRHKNPLFRQFFFLAAGLRRDSAIPVQSGAETGIIADRVAHRDAGRRAAQRSR
jgi:hypothetical protein